MYNLGTVNSKMFFEQIFTTNCSARGINNVKTIILNVIPIAVAVYILAPVISIHLSHLGKGTIHNTIKDNSGSDFTLVHSSTPNQFFNKTKNDHKDHEVSSRTYQE